MPHVDGYGICRALNGLPWRTSDDFRLGITRRYSARWLADEGLRRPRVPWGWAAEKDFDTASWVVGPAWYIWPRRMMTRYRWTIHRLALRLGAAELEEGGYYRDARWWPNCPRFNETLDFSTGVLKNECN